MGKKARQKTASFLKQDSAVLREFSSGGVVFKKLGGKILWIVSASVPNQIFPKLVWRLPKGWIDDEGQGIPGPMASGKVKADENSLKQAAIREVAEEGGIKAKILKKIGTERYFYTHPVRGKILKFVTLYLMEYAGDLEEGFGAETSAVAWLTFDEAYNRLSFAKEKESLRKAKELAPVVQRTEQEFPEL